MGPRPLTVGTEPGYGHLNAVAWVSAKISSALAVTASSRYLRAAHHPATHPITHPSRPPPPGRRSGLTVKTLGDVTVTQVGGGWLWASARTAKSSFTGELALRTVVCENWSCPWT